MFACHEHRTGEEESLHVTMAWLSVGVHRAAQAGLPNPSRRVTGEAAVKVTVLLLAEGDPDSSGEVSLGHDLVCSESRSVCCVIVFGAQSERW